MFPKRILTYVIIVAALAVGIFIIYNYGGSPRGGPDLNCSNFSEFSGPFELVSLDRSNNNQVPSLDFFKKSPPRQKGTHVVWMGFTNNTFDIFYRNRTQEGFWDQTRLVSKEDNESSDFPELVIDNRGVNYVIWRNENRSIDYNSPGQIVHAIHLLI